MSERAANTVSEDASACAQQLWMAKAEVQHAQVLKELQHQQQQKQAAKAPSHLSSLFNDTKSLEQPPAFSFGFS